ncbi:MAG: hypothetical protein ACK553_04500 [Planctomycetota bacterium]
MVAKNGTSWILGMLLGTSCFAWLGETSMADPPFGDVPRGNPSRANISHGNVVKGSVTRGNISRVQPPRAIEVTANVQNRGPNVAQNHFNHGNQNPWAYNSFNYGYGYHPYWAYYGYGFNPYYGCYPMYPNCGYYYALPYQGSYGYSGSGVGVGGWPRGASFGGGSFPSGPSFGGGNGSFRGGR